MKSERAFLLAVLLGSVAAINPVRAADGVVSKEEATASGYCHMKLPAIQARTLGTDNPVPEDASSGDTIDYYGPCDENAVRQHQLRQQRLDYFHNWIMNYSD
jgi:hypothetical protein